MAISIPTGDENIDKLLVELTIIAKKYGKDSYLVVKFIEKNADQQWVDQKTGLMHEFSEIAEGMTELTEGITNVEIEGLNTDEDDPADYWKK